MAEEKVEVEEQNSPPEEDTEKKESTTAVRNYLFEGFYEDGLSESDFFFDESIDSNSDLAECTARIAPWPMQERCVHGEINEITVPLDRSEVFCRYPVMHYEMPPFRNYYHREWSEVAHLFMPAIEFAEQMYGMDSSPCASPSSTTAKGV